MEWGQEWPIQPLTPPSRGRLPPRRIVTQTTSGTVFRAALPHPPSRMQEIKPEPPSPAPHETGLPVATRGRWPSPPHEVSGAWSWLEPHAGAPRFGFTRRDGTGLLGTGIAEQVSGSSIRDVLEQVQGRGGVWFVGGSFDPLGERAPWWKPFGEAHAWRPRSTFRLPAAPVVPRGRAATSVDPDAPPLGRVPDRDAWQELTDRAAAGIADGRFDKVVLARTIAEATETDALAWLRGPLGTREMPFLYEPQPGVAFAGLTPELLFDRLGTTVRSEALAGTDVNTPVGRERLLASDKDAREHALVVDAVTRALSPLCERLDRSGLELAVTGRLVHRLVAFEGRLASPVSDARLADQLHPTPAVAGTPKEPALAFLREHEPFDRGWYAGPVGLVEPGRTTLAVALRCALWHGDTRITYAGAGWVPGSEAQAEWDETELKSLAVRRR